MSYPFTEHVRSLDPRRPAPSAAELERVSLALRQAVAREIRRKGLWQTPPAYLGLVGWPAWGASNETSPGHDALDELVVECYAFIFVDRLRALAAQLGIKDNVEGLVVLNVRHFIFERQRAHDPIGYRTFEVAHGAVRQALADELLTADATPLRNETVLAAPDRPRQLAREPFRQLAPRWVEELMPELVSAGKKGRERLSADLCRNLRRQVAAGLGAFRLRDLVDPLKEAARQACAARLKQSSIAYLSPEGLEPQADTDSLPPDQPMIDHDDFRHLVAEVKSLIETSGLTARTQRYMLVLWQFVSALADDRPTDLLAAAGTTGDPDALPSHRQLASALGIPRGRLPQLLDDLRQTVRLAQALRDARQPGQGPQPQVPVPAPAHHD